MDLSNGAEREVPSQQHLHDSLSRLLQRHRPPWRICGGGHEIGTDAIDKLHGSQLRHKVEPYVLWFPNKELAFGI